MSFVPLGSDGIARLPGLAFFESAGALRTALNAVPDARPASVWLDGAEADEEADALLTAYACVLSA